MMPISSSSTKAARVLLLSLSVLGTACSADVHGTPGAAAQPVAPAHAGTGPSCRDVCTRGASLCQSKPAEDCLSRCEGKLAMVQQSCVMSATTCEEAMECGAPAVASGDAGAPPATRAWSSPSREPDAADSDVASERIEVCNHGAELCGDKPGPGCAEHCATHVSGVHRECIVTATSCAAATVCVLPAPPVATRRGSARRTDSVSRPVAVEPAVSWGRGAGRAIRAAR